MAFSVRNKPIGTKTIAESHMPVNGLVTPSLANFSPKVFSILNNTKKTIANTSGVPKPPRRIMEPSGAPMRNNTMQAAESVNFRFHSI